MEYEWPSEPQFGSEQFRLRTRPIEIQSALRCLETRLRFAQAAEETISAAMIATAEALNNIAEHAYRGRTDGEIIVCLMQSSSAFVVQLTDFGRAPTAEAVAKAGLPEISGNRKELPEGGFGLFLIKSLASSVRHASTGGRNFLELSFSLPVSG